MKRWRKRSGIGYSFGGIFLKSSRRSSIGSQEYCSLSGSGSGEGVSLEGFQHLTLEMWIHDSSAATQTPVGVEEAQDLPLP
jgi:hypothetical protein